MLKKWRELVDKLRTEQFAVITALAPSLDYIEKQLKMAA
jgi:hypothetical protein